MKRFLASLIFGTSAAIAQVSTPATLGSAKMTVTVSGTGFSGSAAVPLSLASTSTSTRVQPL